MYLTAADLTTLLTYARKGMFATGVQQAERDGYFTAELHANMTLNSLPKIVLRPEPPVPAFPQ